jgi:hypothetical protein
MGGTRSFRLLRGLHCVSDTGNVSPRLLAAPKSDAVLFRDTPHADHVGSSCVSVKGTQTRVEL